MPTLIEFVQEYLGKELQDYQKKFLEQVEEGNITNIQLSRNSREIPLLEACKIYGTNIDYIVIDEIEESKLCPEN